MRLLTAAGVPGGVVDTGLEAVRADTNLLVFGLLLAGCLLYASILLVDAVAESRDALGKDDSDSPSGR